MQKTLKRFTAQLTLTNQHIRMKANVTWSLLEGIHKPFGAGFTQRDAPHRILGGVYVYVNFKGPACRSAKPVLAGQLAGGNSSNLEGLGLPARLANVADCSPVDLSKTLCPLFPHQPFFRSLLVHHLRAYNRDGRR
ncbi:hypothetical protein CORC01_06081 [Colletotrichum orchidophilum]|uniref:Uncharacterized protein n=1 Tax=Colletotrichum orchidophilum TaxID=1209926 RepID=A0A1G4BB53_9PEZI|nr:uncharacterized protein CORC01_06081 [Colletotrichum orchidophilum]OHE98630.1 hypothetical protein CORC01_06081 [Colletotrichum orchidophilum]